MQRIFTSVVVLTLASGAWTISSAQERDDRNNTQHEERSRSGYANERYRNDENYDHRDDRRLNRGDYDRRNSYEGRRSNPFTGEWNRENIEVSKLPDAVQKTIRKEGRDLSVIRVDQDSQRGKVQYRVQVRDQGQRRYMTIAADGTLLGATAPASDYEDVDYARLRERERDRDRQRWEEQSSRAEPRWDRGYGRNDRRENYRGRPDYADDFDGYSPNRRYDDRDRYRGRMDYRDDDRYAEPYRRMDPPPVNRPGDRQWSRDRDYERGDRNYDPSYDRENSRTRYQEDDRRDYDRYESRRSLNRGDYDDPVVRMSDLPPNVRQTINQHAGDKSIERIERETSRGQVRYRVHLRDESTSAFFRVDSNGDYLSAEPDGENKTSPDKSSSSVEKKSDKTGADASSRSNPSRVQDTKPEAPATVPNK